MKASPKPILSSEEQEILSGTIRTFFPITDNVDKIPFREKVVIGNQDLPKEEIKSIMKIVKINSGVQNSEFLNTKKIKNNFFI